MQAYPSNNRRPSAITGFTLMELLVVITIISVLAGFMFPAAKGVLATAERSSAENTAHNLKNSIAAYFTEYRKYPVRSGTQSSDTEVESDNTLMDVLLASNSEATAGGLNPRRITYFSGRQAKRSGAGKGYRKGVQLDGGGAGRLFDPYSEYYRVKMDTDYNNRLDAPSWVSENELPMTIIVWSAGKDTLDDEAADNIKTW